MSEGLQVGSKEINRLEESNLERILFPPELRTEFKPGYKLTRQLRPEEIQVIEELGSRFFPGGEVGEVPI